jgi:hypothetical protein
MAQYASAFQLGEGLLNWYALRAVCPFRLRMSGGGFFVIEHCPDQEVAGSSPAPPAEHPWSERF